MNAFDSGYIRFSVVKLLADAVREISIPIGVVAEYGEKRDSRFLDRLTPALRALSHPADRETAIRFGHQAPEILGTSASRHLTLDELAKEGIGGFIFTEPRELKITQKTLDSEVDFLFRHFVAPRTWGNSKLGQSRLSTQVRHSLRQMAKIADQGPLVEVDVEFQAPGIEACSFDGAIANGKLTLLKAVDLAVQLERVRNHTNEALADAALLRAMVPDERFVQIAIANPSSAIYDPKPHLKALEQLYVHVFHYPEQADELEAFVLQNAQDDVSEKARSLGLEAKTVGPTLVIEGGRNYPDGQISLTESLL